MTITQRIELPYESAARDLPTKRRSLLLVGGLLIGLATSLPLAQVWHEVMRPPVGVCLLGTDANPAERIWLDGHILPIPCMPTLIFLRPLVSISFLTAGVVFGLIAHKLAGRGSRSLVAALGGITFITLIFLGGLFVPRINTPPLPDLFSSGVAEPFAVMVFGISFLFALVLGLALRTPGWHWRALVSAVVTGLCYWLVMWLLLGRVAMFLNHDPTTLRFADHLPDLGNGMGPMLKTMLVSNLIAGTVGGWFTLALLSNASYKGHAVVGGEGSP